MSEPQQDPLVEALREALEEASTVKQSGVYWLLDDRKYTLPEIAAHLRDRLDLDGEERRFRSWEECREAYLHDPVLYNFVHSLIAESHNRLLRDSDPTAADRGEGEAADNQNYVVEKLMEALTEAADRGQFTKALEAAVEAVGCIYEDLRPPPTFESGEERDLRCRCQSLPGGKQHPDCPMDGHGLPDSRPLDAGARRRELADELDALRSSEAVEMIPSSEGGEETKMTDRLENQAEDWTPTLYEDVVTALINEDDGESYFVARWTLDDLPEFFGDGESREQAVERLMYATVSMLAAYADDEFMGHPSSEGGEES